MLPFQDIKNGRFYLGDCLEVMKSIPDGVVDMILCDLPYGTTQNKWDSIIRLSDVWVYEDLIFEKFEDFVKFANERNITIGELEKYKKAGLWSHYWRIAKPNAAIVLTAQTPFDKVLGMSCIDYLKYEWIWEKTAATGHLNAKKAPMKAHENILVFYKNLPTYNPQKTTNHKPVHSYTKHQDDGSCYGATKTGISGGGSTERYPRSVIVHASDKQTCSIHPTQKPVALFEYLIKTYTNEGDLVLDNCAGSGTTAVASENTNRRWICIEQLQEYADKAVNRILNHI